MFYFLLDMNLAIIIMYLFIATFIFIVIPTEFTKFIGKVFFLILCFASAPIIFTESSPDGARSTSLPSKQYIEDITKKYELQDFIEEHPDNKISKYLLNMPTIGFKVCHYSNYSGKLCKGYLKYYENNIVKYKKEILNEPSNGYTKKNIDYIFDEKIK